MQSDDVNLKGILIFLAILALTLTVTYGAIAGLWHGLEKKARRADEQILLHAPSAAAQAGQPYFPGPREQPNPVADLHALRAQEEAELNTYGWIDKTTGVVRIPIDRAIDVLLTKPSEGHP